MFLKRGQNLLQNGILNFAFKLSQSSGKRGLAAKGLTINNITHESNYHNTKLI